MTIKDDLYEFMYLGHDLMRTFESMYPDDHEGLEVLAVYVGLATTLACKAIEPESSHQDIVNGYWQRISQEQPDMFTQQARH